MESTRTQKLQELADQLDLPDGLAAPGLWRLYWKLGLDVKSPLFASALSTFAHFLAVLGPTSLLINWIGFDGEYTVVAILLAIAGAGVAADYYRRIRAKYQLPSWSDFLSEGGTHPVSRVEVGGAPAFADSRDRLSRADAFLRHRDRTTLERRLVRVFGGDDHRIPLSFLGFWSIFWRITGSIAFFAMIAGLVDRIVAIIFLLSSPLFGVAAATLLVLIRRAAEIPTWKEYIDAGAPIGAEGRSRLREIQRVRGPVSRRGVLVTAVLGSLALIGSVHLMLIASIHESTAWMLEGYASDDTIVTTGDASYSLQGTVSIENTILEPGDGERGASPVRIGRMVLQTPGLWWLLRAGTIFEDDYPPTDALTLRIEGIDWTSVGIGRVLPVLSTIGGYSASPYEAAGCERDRWFSRERMTESLGGKQGMGNIRIEYKVEGPSKLAERIEFAGANSKVVHESVYLLPGAATDFANSDTEEWGTTSWKWTIEDAGFVRARNSYCAGQAGISEVEFLDRHIASMQRENLAKGFVEDQRSLDLYRRFAQSGGTLTWKTRLPAGKAIEDFDPTHHRRWLSALGMLLALEGTGAVDYSTRMVDPVPLPERVAFSRPLVDILRAEGVLADDVVEAPPATEASAKAEGREGLAQRSIRQSSRIEPSVRPGGPAASPVSTVGEPARTTGPVPIPLRELPRRVGTHVVIKLHNGRSYSGYVDRAGSERVHLRVRRSGGSATLTFTNSQIASVEG